MRALGRSKKATAIFVAAVSVAATVATMSFADEGDGRGTPEPGVPIPASQADPSAPGGGADGSPIHTGFFTNTYDPTILTKFIPASGFAGDTGDVLNYPANFICQNAALSPAGFHELRAPVELPNGAKILRFKIFGSDTSAGFEIFGSLDKTEVATPFLGSTTLSDGVVVASVSTTGTPGIFGVQNSTDLNEVTGNVSFLSSSDKWYEIYVSWDAAAAANIRFCGAEVTYQVPAVANAFAQAFYPISPIRAFDSRLAGYAPNNTAFAPSTSRVISIKDGHDSAGAVNLVDAVPAFATAVTYNITVTGPTGPNFLAVTAGDATSFTASAINFNGTADIANGGTVSIPFDRTIKIWCGDQTGSTNVIIDITGYYAPLPNMGN